MFSEGLKSDLQLKIGYINNSVKVLSSQVLAMSKNKKCVYCLGSLFYHLTIPMWKEFFSIQTESLLFQNMCLPPHQTAMHQSPVFLSGGWKELRDSC